MPVAFLLNVLHVFLHDTLLNKLRATPLKAGIAWGCMMLITMTGGAAADTEPILDGAVTDMSHMDAPKTTTSKDIVAFFVRFAWNDQIGHSENGMFIPDDEQPYPQGIWQLTLKKSQRGAELEMRCDNAGLHVAGTVPDIAFRTLQELIELHGVTRLNGHSKRDSALGELLDLSITYASGERITAYAEGGSATLPEKYWDQLWFLDFFRKIAMNNALWPVQDAK